jgi:hypothetical protein
MSRRALHELDQQGVRKLVVAGDQYVRVNLCGRRPNHFIVQPEYGPDCRMSIGKTEELERTFRNDQRQLEGNR